MPKEKKTHKNIGAEQLFPGELIEILGISTPYKLAKRNILHMSSLLG